MASGQSGGKGGDGGKGGAGGLGGNSGGYVFVSLKNKDLAKVFNKDNGLEGPNGISGRPGFKNHLLRIFYSIN